MRFRLIPITLILMGLGTAYATCKNGAKDYPKCTPPVTLPTNGQPVSSSASVTGVSAIAGSNASIDNRVNSNLVTTNENQSRATGGSVGNVSNRANSSSAGGSGGSTGDVALTVTGDAAGAGDSYRSHAYAPVIHGAGAAPVAAGNLMVIPGKCGPMVWIDSQTVRAKQIGVFGGQYDIEQTGFERQTIMPADVPFIERNGQLWGHIVTKYAVVVGASTAGSWSIGGFTGKGDGGQAGSAGSGSLQQLVKQYDIEQCIYAERKEVVLMQPEQPVRLFTPAIVCPAPVVRKMQARKPSRVVKPAMCQAG